MKRKSQERKNSPVSKHDKWFIPQNILREARFNEAITNRRQKEKFGKSFGQFQHRTWSCGCCLTHTEMTEHNLQRPEDYVFPQERTRPKRRKLLMFEKDGKFLDIDGKRVR